MRVHHLDCLTMCPPFARWVNGTGGVLERARMICHVLLVETDAHGLVLVDTAIGTDDCADSAGRLGTPFAWMMGIERPPLERTAVRQIERLGLRREDVRHVIVTHLDLDHAGGLPDFPEAKVHVMAGERDAALARRTLAERRRYRPCHFAHGPRWATYRARGETWRGLECVRQLEGLPPEILMVPMTGHTRGHACVAIETRDRGTLVHAGDAYFHREAVRGAGEIPWGLGVFERSIAVDGSRIAANHARLRALATQGVHVFCAHDEHEIADFRGHAGAGLQRGAPAGTRAA